MTNSTAVETIRSKFQLLSSYLNEKTLRIWAATEAQSIGHGGITSVSQATGLSRNTIYKGISEMRSGNTEPGGVKAGRRVREPGGGRKRITEKDITILHDIESLIEPMIRGDPGSPLLWTCKSTTKLAKELRAMGHSVGQRTVCDLLSDMGYSLQSNRKRNEGGNHPDRNEQFLHISETVKAFQKLEQPVISVDTKKKELIGNFRNNGREWSEKGKPVDVKVHDFVDPDLGKVVPYGIYDLSANNGWVNVGIDHDTAEFAVESIRRWWNEMGKPIYNGASDLLITADCGGSNGYRVRLWKFGLQKLADELDITMHICHFPPGTSKWNKIEHRMFCHITQNWRGRPLISRETVINLISNTKTATGLTIRAGIDQKKYATGVKVSDEEFNSILIETEDFHGEWNYRIKPGENV